MMKNVHVLINEAAKRIFFWQNVVFSGGHFDLFSEKCINDSQDFIICICYNSSVKFATQIKSLCAFLVEL